jgi:hypothetical protein
MIIGFTGPRTGMNITQEAWLETTFRDKQPTEFHHGACTGCDQTAHSIARSNLPGCLIVVHPPVNHIFLAGWCIADADKVLPAKRYHDRDRDIVDVCDLLLSTPAGEPYQGSGTWFTINYALSQHKPVLVCYPDGTVDRL